MQTRYRLFPRGRIFYYEDAKTGKQTSLRTSDRKIARRLLHAMEEAEQLPALNLQIAKAYLHAVDPAFTKRTWADVLARIMETKRGDTLRRWQIVDKDAALFPLKNQIVITTTAELFLRVIHQGTVSTNVFLRRIHNFALDMSWLLNPVIPKRAWPKFEFRPKRAITKEKHLLILAREQTPERKAFSLRSEAINQKIAEWNTDPRELRRVAGIYGYGGKVLTETEKRQIAALETRPRKVVAARADLAAAKKASRRRIVQAIKEQSMHVARVASDQRRREAIELAQREARRKTRAEMVKQSAKIRQGHAYAFNSTLSRKPSRGIHL